jgi:predicted ribosome quality control (RQC) complex YloA/Tae2 family protein
MSFDGLMMHHLTIEYKEALLFHRVDKIMYVRDDVFVFELYHQKEKKLLYIDMHANDNRLYFAPYEEIKYDDHPSLSMLKKSLLRTQIKDILQYQTDRVCIITFEKYDAFDGATSFDLVIEMMGKHANMILIKEMRILEAYKKMVHTASRSIAYHLPFTFFPSDKKLLTSFNLSLHEHDRFVEDYEGMSKDLAQQILRMQVNPYDLPLQPSIKKNKRFSYDVGDGNSYPSINAMMQVSHSQDLSDAVFKTLLKKREMKLPKLKDDLYHHQSHLKDYLIAEKLYTYHDSKAYVSHVEDIELDRLFSVHEHAQHYFQTYNKAKRAIPQLEKQILETEHELLFLNQLLFDFHAKTLLYEEALDLLYQHNYIHKKPILKKQLFKKPIEIILDGFRILIGKNAKLNTIVTHELSKPSDYFMHVKDAPGGHVICNAPKESHVFLIALKYAAFFSTLKHASKIEVMAALKKDVKKIPGMHGSMVSIKTYTSYIVELEDEFVKLCESL